MYHVVDHSSAAGKLRSSTPRATPLKTIRIGHRRGPHTLTYVLCASELGDEPFESALIHEETAIYEDGNARAQALAPRSDRHRQPPTQPQQVTQFSQPHRAIRRRFETVSCSGGAAQRAPKERYGRPERWWV